MQPYRNFWRRGFTDPHIDDQVLSARVAESVAWCESIGKLTAFRQPTLTPNIFHNGPDDLVCDVAQSRQNLLQRSKISVQHQLPIAVTGKFMLYFPDENLTDGAAEIKSSGFFDVFNLPPFDTWVSFFEDESRSRSSPRYLLCYVPSFAISVADAGIDVNPEECIIWLDKSDVSIIQRLNRIAKQT